MKITAIKTTVLKPGEDIFSFLDKSIKNLKNGDIIAITSKIISISQNRIIAKNKKLSKYDLIKQEAEKYLPESESVYGAHLTIKYGMLIPSAGIDESNADNHYILYPKHIQKTTEDIWLYLKNKFKLQKLGVIITDSRVISLRRGVTGMSLSWCGFEPLYSYIGKKDLFNRPLKVTQINLLDALASSAVLVMGEGNEKIPLVLIQNAPKIAFVKRPPTRKEKNSLKIALEDDLFSPLLDKVRWLNS